MDLFSLVHDYWSYPKIEVNIIIFLNILGSLLLGTLLGYERYYNGRAAGMRTYGLVCMTSCALVVILGFPQDWYGGHAVLSHTMSASDPTRVIQGILTGIGFLGAGLIMKEGFNISGLTSAASIWASSAIGILVGIGFYGAAILLTLLSVFCMIILGKIEYKLPAKKQYAIELSFNKDYEPNTEYIYSKAKEKGFNIVESSLAISKGKSGGQVWRFNATANVNNSMTLGDITAKLNKDNNIEKFHISYSKN